MNELELAKSIATGALQSPQLAGQTYLYALRITGTGAAYRSKLNEFVYRPPENYLNDDFLARCSGLPVVWEHPDNSRLNSEEFAARTIGTIFYPYLKDSEVWGIAKIFDIDAIEQINKGGLSTSPCVVFDTVQERQFIEIDGNQEKILIEETPTQLDHLAICENGVWDKGGDPAGIDVNINNEEGVMPDDLNPPLPTEPADKAMDEKIYELLVSMDERLKTLEGAKADDNNIPVPEPAPEPPKADDDGDLKDRIEKVESKMDSMLKDPEPVSDSDLEDIADTQAKAENVAHAFGDSVIKAMAGETPLAYRKRVVRKYQSHSPTFKDANIESIGDSAILKAITETVFADSMKAAKSPANIGDGMPRAIKNEGMGRLTIDYVGGKQGAAFSQFMAKPQKGHLGLGA